MKKLIFTVMICMIFLSFMPVLAEESRVEPGMSAVLKRGAYYYVGSDIPEGSYIFNCVDNENTDWVDACYVVLSTYDYLRLSEDLGKAMEFPELEDGYGPIHAFLKAGTVVKVQYSDVTITAVEPVTSGKLDKYSYYGIGYDIPEGAYYLTCDYEEDSEWRSTCGVMLSGYELFYDDEMSQLIYLDTYEEDDTYSPKRIYLPAGMVLETIGTPVQITPAEPLSFE